MSRARELRKKMTPSEKTLWEYLKNKQLLGLRFRRQHPIDIFIVDFYCHNIKLVIELDGGIHDHPENKEHDKNRTAHLEKFGIKVIRFTNEEVITDVAKVGRIIKEECKKLLKKNSPI